MPESFTHGTSEQRQRWLKRGLETGKLRELRYLREPISYEVTPDCIRPMTGNLLAQQPQGGSHEY